MSFINEIAQLDYGWVFLLKFLLTILIGALSIVVIVTLTRRVLKKSNKIDDAIVAFIVNAVKVACIIVLLTILLQMLGVKTSTIVTVLGAAGAAIALALKDSLANIAGGVMIIVTHPFGQGDLISIGDDRGVVEHIDLFRTTLKTLDCRTITIPNGTINTSVVYNESDREIRRVDLHFTVAYDTDIDKAREILENVCQADPIIMNSPEPFIGVIEHGDSALVIECLAYCKTSDIVEARYYLNETVKVAFEEADIEIPYPHVDVTMRR